MEVVPNIDLLGGRCVRLVQGDFDQATYYDVDPVEFARRAVEAGIGRLHVVDLDAARGSGDNRQVVERIVRSAGLEVQVAGGIRARTHVEDWLAAGAAGVVMGTTAVREPEVLEECASEHPGRVLAALDLKAGRPAITGWGQVGEASLEDVLRAWESAPLAAIILTSVDRDGTLAGPDLEALRRVRRHTSHWVIYGGGISSIADVAALREAGAGGIIVGKAVMEGKVALEEILAAV